MNINIKTWSFIWRLIPNAISPIGHFPIVSPQANNTVLVATVTPSSHVEGGISGQLLSSSSSSSRSDASWCDRRQSSARYNSTAPPAAATAASTVAIPWHGSWIDSIPYLWCRFCSCLLGDLRARDLPQRGRDRPAQRKKRAIPLASLSFFFSSSNGCFIFFL